MTGFGRDKPVSGHRPTDPRGPHDRGPVRPFPGRPPLQPAGRFSHAEPQAAGPAWWPGMRRGLPSLGVALLLALFGMGLLYWRGPVAGPGTLDLVVWRAPGQAEVALSSVGHAEWQAFLASRREIERQTHQEIVDQARTETVAALAPLFDAMRGRVKDYTSWFFFYPTVFRMLFTSVSAVLSADKSEGRSVEQVATLSLNRLLQDRFLELVVVSEKYGPVTEALERAVMKRAIGRAQEAAAKENAALTAFMTEHGKPAGNAAGQQVTISWEVLVMPAPAFAMSAPPDAVALIKVDPALTGLQTNATTEGMLFVARQFARRATQASLGVAARDTLTPMLVGSFGPAEVLVAPLLGFTAFGIGLGAEFGAVKMREVVESPRLTELSNDVVDRLRENQSAVLADGVSRRIETWLGE